MGAEKKTQLRLVNFQVAWRRKFQVLLTIIGATGALCGTGRVRSGSCGVVAAVAWWGMGNWQRWAKGLIDRSSDTDSIFWFYRTIQSVDAKFRFLYRPIASVRFEFRFFKHLILFLGLKFRFLYQPIVSVRSEFQFFNRPILFFSLKFRFLYRAIVSASFK